MRAPLHLELLPRQLQLFAGPPSCHLRALYFFLQFLRFFRAFVPLRLLLRESGLQLAQLLCQCLGALHCCFFLAEALLELSGCALELSEVCIQLSGSGLRARLLLRASCVLEPELFVLRAEQLQFDLRLAQLFPHLREHDLIGLEVGIGLDLLLLELAQLLLLPSHFVREHPLYFLEVVSCLRVLSAQLLEAPLHLRVLFIAAGHRALQLADLEIAAFQLRAQLLILGLHQPERAFELLLLPVQGCQLQRPLF